MKSGGWVRNGDRWVITGVRADGAVAVRRAGQQIGRRRTMAVVLPGEYVAEHLDLGYAVTAHRAQGVTVDTAHVMVSARTTRENLYVSMTRGRSSNTAYVALDHPDDSHPPSLAGDEVTASSVLHGVLRHAGAELSAHETVTADQESWTSIAQLAAEYETLAAAAQHERWIALLSVSGLSDDEAAAVAASSSFGPLSALLRRTEALGRDPAAQLEKAVSRRTLDGAEDVGAVLHRRLAMSTSRATGTGSGFIAGLIPAARGDMTLEYETALRQRAHQIENRAHALAADAVRQREPWVSRLGPPPADPAAHARWMRAVAYRDRYQIHGAGPLGPVVASASQRADAERARAALRRAVATGVMRRQARESGINRVLT